MLNQSSRYLIGILVAFACVSPVMAQQAGDPLTRFLDGVFKRPAGTTAPADASRQAQQPPATPVTQAQPSPAPPAQAPAQTNAKTDPKKKIVASKPQAPKPQRPAQPKPEAKPEPQPEQQATPQPKPVPAEPEKAEAKLVVPEPQKPSEEEPAVQAAEQPKPKEPPVQVAEPPAPVSPPPAPVHEPPKVANVSPKQAASASTPVVAKAPVTPTAPPVPSSPAAALDRVNAYFNGMDQMTATFVQKNPNGQQAEGTLAVRRPGILQFVYAPPSTLEIISDGRNVAIRDKRLGTNDVYPVGQTPLKFLLQDNFDLARDTKVRDVQVGRDGMVTVRFDDTATLGGTSKITLRFDTRANVLRQWTIVDGQGYETSVTLSDVNMVRRKDASAAN